MPATGPIRLPWIAALGGLAVLLVAGGGFPERPTEPPVRRTTTLERMQLPRLAAAHADIVRLALDRRDVPARSGLRDFRGVCHVHAEDSAHTGGTRAEMLAEARKAGVQVILLSDHYRPPRDFMDSWRGVRDGVLFIPGSEARGMLIHPQRSVVPQMEGPEPDLVAAVTADGGLAFLSHLEERMDHPMGGLDGLEIYNRHWDAKRDRTTMLALAFKLTNPRDVSGLTQALEMYPAELLAAQIDYPADYLAKWDAECARRRLTGIAANDAHHNQVFVVKRVDESTVALGTSVDPDEKLQRVSALLRPSIRELTRGHRDGDVLVRLDFDPYSRSFLSVCTHILASELTEPAIREALKEGHAFVSHDWMGDATGFRFEAHAPEALNQRSVSMGDEVPFREGLELRAQFPFPCSRIRLLRNGVQIASGRGYRLDYPATEPGAHRVEGWLRLDGEERCWILSNPIYLR